MLHTKTWAFNFSWQESATLQYFFVSKKLENLFVVYTIYIYNMFQRSARGKYFVSLILTVQETYWTYLYCICTLFTIRGTTQIINN